MELVNFIARIGISRREKQRCLIKFSAAKRPEPNTFYRRLHIHYQADVRENSIFCGVAKIDVGRMDLSNYSSLALWLSIRQSK
jgi:hypothetical protein